MMMTQNGKAPTVMRIDWLEVDGQRIDEAKATRSTEYRCDACGEFVAEPVKVQIQLFPWHGPAASLPPFDLHAACMKQCLLFVQVEKLLSQQGITLP